MPELTSTQKIISNLSKEKVHNYSEKYHQEQMNHLMFKFNREQFKKNIREKKLLKQFAANLESPFVGKTIMRWTDPVLDQPTSQEKKLRKL